MKVLFKNIKELIQVREESFSFVAGDEMKRLPTLKDAYLLVNDGKISDYGTMSNCPDVTVEEVVDATGQMLLPSWCDSHTLKSGYGLTPNAELKMLRVIRRLRENYPIPIKATFLAAHALPLEYKHDKPAFLKLMIDEVLPIIAEEQLASYIDVFCETGYFTPEDTELVLQAGAAYGLVPKIHVNQFTTIGGVKVGVDNHALSVDHLEVMGPGDINSLKGSRTMPVALPSCSYFLGIPYTPAREIIDAGLPLAIASDYNPGSTPSGNMNFVLSTACIKLRMTPEEAINAATLNGAYAMGLETEVGSITRGKQANLLLTKPINSYGVLPYAFGTNHIEQVYLQGKKWIG